MGFLRDIQRGFARKLGFILAGLAVALVLSLLGIGKAQAQANTYDQAMAQCQAWIASVPSTYGNPPWSNPRCGGQGQATDGSQDSCGTDACLIGYLDYNQGSTHYVVARTQFFFTCPADKPYNAQLGMCGNGCDIKPPITSGWTTQVGNMCHDGCQYSKPPNAIDVCKTIDGIQYCSAAGWLANGADLTPTSCPGGVGQGLVTPPADSDNDGKSDGNDPAPFNPGQSEPPQAPPPPPGGCGGEGQPECLPPPDGSGNDEGEGSGNGNTSTGGGDCNTPPSSNGDAIAANNLYQNWATRCAAEKGNAGVVTGDPTQCNAAYSCVGDQVQCAQVHQLRALVCKGAITGPSPGDANGDGQPDWTQTAGENANDDGSAAHAGDDAWGEDEEASASLDASGFGFGTTCPNPPTVMGNTLDFSEFCTLMGYVGLLILAAAHMHALYIFAGE